MPPLLLDAVVVVVIGGEIQTDRVPVAAVHAEGALVTGTEIETWIRIVVYRLLVVENVATRRQRVGLAAGVDVVGAVAVVVVGEVAVVVTHVPDLARGLVRLLLREEIQDTIDVPHTAPLLACISCMSITYLY